MRDFLSGKSKSPSVASVEKLCLALGVTLEEVLAQPEAREDVRIARLMSLLSLEQRQQIVDFAEWQAANQAEKKQESPED